MTPVLRKIGKMHFIWSDPDPDCFSSVGSGSCFSWQSDTAEDPLVSRGSDPDPCRRLSLRPVTCDLLVCVLQSLKKYSCFYVIMSECMSNVVFLGICPPKNIIIIFLSIISVHKVVFLTSWRFIHFPISPITSSTKSYPAIHVW